MTWPISTTFASSLKYDLEQYGTANGATRADLLLMPELDDFVRAQRVADSLKEIAMSRLQDVLDGEED